MEKCQPSLEFNYVWGTDFMCSCFGAAISSNRNVLVLKKVGLSQDLPQFGEMSDVDVFPLWMSSPHQLWGGSPGCILLSNSEKAQKLLILQAKKKNCLERLE